MTRSRLQTGLIILMHVRELTLPTGTARLAQAAIPRAELRLRGGIEPMSNEGLLTPDRHSLLLYPSEEARTLTPDFVASLDKPVTLVVPDGSWRQGRKTTQREPALKQMTHVKLPPGPPSRYRLRKEPNEQSVSTFEAIARAYGVLEGPEAQTILEDLFELRIERALWTRGALTKEQCRFEIPQAAFDAFYAAGCRGGALSQARTRGEGSASDVCSEM